MDVRFSDDIRKRLLKKEALPIIDSLPGESKLTGIDPQWVEILGNALVKSVVFTNFNGDSGQAGKIADDFTKAIRGKRMAYGFTSTPNNRAAGKSDSIMALKSRLGVKGRFPGTNTIFESGLKHLDTSALKEDANPKNSRMAVVVARAAHNVKHEMDKMLSDDEKRSMYLGNLILMNDDAMADLVGVSEEDVSGGSAFILTGYNSEYGTLQWKQITSRMQNIEDPNPFDLDK